MKIIGKLLFFNKSFMNEYTTTIGQNIYFPNEKYVVDNYQSAKVILMHELTHITDASKISPLFFSFLYSCPQIISILCIPLFFINFYLSLLFFIFILPLPAFFRMYFEKRAYFVSLYVSKKIGRSNLEEEKNFIVENFKNSSYYFMWPFSGLSKSFDNAMIKINNDERPFQDPIFDIIDDLIKK
jgi:hypothetical protein